MTIAEIAKQAGVAKSTVSNVLNGKCCVTDKTRDKVLDICRKNNFQPNFYSKNLSNSKNKGNVRTNIASIFLDSGDNKSFSKFYLQLLEGVITGLKIYRYDLLINYHNINHKIENKLRVGSSPIDGAIILTPRNSDFRISSLNDLLIPFVVIGSVKDKEISCIDINNRKLVYIVTTSMIKHGFNNICLLNSQEELTISKDRSKGMKEAIKENNNCFTKNVYDSDNLDHEELINSLLDDHFTGFITSNVRKAKIIYDVCKKRNLKVGKDVAIFSLGYSTSINVEAFTPRLSYAYQDYIKIGLLASEMLIKKIAKEEVENIIIDSEICWGESLSE